MSVPTPPRRSTSPVHYDFLPKSTNSPASSSPLASNQPASYEKTRADHPPVGPQANAHPDGTNEQDHDGDTDSDGTNSSDEFDWDNDDDAQSKVVVGEKKAKRGRRVWLAYKKLAPVFRTTILAVIFGGIFVTPALLFLLVFKSTPARGHVIPWSLWVATTWVASCILSLIVDLAPRFVLWLVFLVYGKAPEIFKTQLELFMAVSFWLKLALDVSAGWVSLSLIRHILNPPGRYWTIVNRVVQALFGSAIVLLVEKLFVRIIAIRFHQKALADRLNENRVALKALDKLSSATPAAAKKKQNAARRRSAGPDGALTGSPYNSRPGTPEIKANGVSHKKNFSTTSEKEKVHGDAVGHAKVKAPKRKKSKAVTDLLKDQLVDLKDAIEQVALKDSKFNREGEIGSLYSARRLAQNLFSNLSSVWPPRHHLLVEDFYPYFRTEADAHVAFSLFDQDDNGDISKKEMREAVQRIYRERKALSASLKDMSSAVAKLDAVMVGIGLIIIIFICIFVFNPTDSLTSLIPLATIVLGFSFVFGNSAKTVFESLIFIFSTHVYDVGDLIIVDDQILTVKEFGLFATTFRRVDGQEVVAPNSLLATTKLIQNMRRSGSQWETTALNISYNTPIEVVEQLKVKLRQYMSEHSREWGTPGVEVWIDNMKFQNEINLTVAMEHRHNWQDWGGRWGRRNLFMKYLRTSLEELEIGYQLPLHPITFHPSSAPPPWVQGNQDYQGHNPLYGNAGLMPRDPIRNATSPSGIPSLNIPRF
ncbi:hypothetical protein FRB94_014552 [Tulasnella sp. JGI-2019a]|nr:hypothetical protein FRB94_014552 [Tulasnella sp. JGI-2019a]